LAYAALLFYIAVLFVRPQEWVSFMWGWPVLDFAVGAALVTWVGSLTRTRWRLRDAPQNWLMLGLFAAVLMSHVAHTFFAALISSFQSFGKVVLLYFLIASLVSSVRRAKTLVTVMVIGCLFLATHGILQSVRATPAGPGRGFGPNTEPFRAMRSFEADGTALDRVRGLGIFHDPNDLALILVAMLPFLFRKVIDREASAPARALSAGAAGWMLYAIRLTNSRGGWLALAVMCAAFAAVHLQTPRGRKLAVAAGLLLFAAAVALAPGRMGQYDTKDASARGRWAAWGEGMAMLKRNPAFGVGYGRFTEFADMGKVAHNSFVHCYAETGLFGYFFFVALIMACLMDGHAMTRLGLDAAGGELGPPSSRDGPPGASPKASAAGVASGGGGGASADAAGPGELRGFARALVPSLLGYLAACFFLSRTYVVPLYILFGLFAVLRTELKRAGYNPPGLFERRHLRWVLGAEFASIVAIHAMTRILW